MKQRLFLALDLPDSIKEQVKFLQNDLEKLGLPVVWESGEKLHLTLNFLGNVDTSQLIQLKTTIKKSLAEFEPFQLLPQFLETLYNRHEASLVYLGLAGDVQVLKQLHKSLSDGLNNIQIPQPIRFLPHITIGRFKRTDPVTTKRFMDQISQYEYSPVSGFIVNSVILYRSYVSRAGSHFEKIVTFTFE